MSRAKTAPDNAAPISTGRRPIRLDKRPSGNCAITPPPITAATNAPTPTGESPMRVANAAPMPQKAPVTNPARNVAIMAHGTRLVEAGNRHRHETEYDQHARKEKERRTGHRHRQEWQLPRRHGHQGE